MEVNWNKMNGTNTRTQILMKSNSSNQILNNGLFFDVEYYMQDTKMKITIDC